MPENARIGEVCNFVQEMQFYTKSHKNPSTSYNTYMRTSFLFC